MYTPNFGSCIIGISHPRPNLSRPPNPILPQTLTPARPSIDSTSIRIEVIILPLNLDQWRRRVYRHTAKAPRLLHKHTFIHQDLLLRIHSITIDTLLVQVTAMSVQCDADRIWKGTRGRKIDCGVFSDPICGCRWSSQ